MPQATVTLQSGELQAGIQLEGHLLKSRTGY